LKLPYDASFSNPVVIFKSRLCSREAEKLGWALETTKAAEASAKDALEREREAYERKVGEQRAKKSEQKVSRCRVTPG
jgi:hypothetical protein